MTNLLWKLTHAHSRSTAEATVESCEWVRSHDHAGEIAGHYQIKFTYRAGENGQINHGQFCHEGVRRTVPYAVGDRLTVEYDPKKPTHCHFNGASANYEKLEAILVMTVFALLAGYVLYTF